MTNNYHMEKNFHENRSQLEAGEKPNAHKHTHKQVKKISKTLETHRERRENENERLNWFPRWKLGK